MNEKRPSNFERVETGIPGLDTLLNGGFLSGGTYLILGAPGTGKTIFSNQLSFHQAKSGGKALYVTLLAENHSRMFGNLEPMHFFEHKRVSSTIQYISGFKVLEKEGLDGLLKLLGDLVRRHGTTILFIDGVASVDDLSHSSISFKKFVHNLNSVLGMSGCTTFLLSSAEGDETKPEYTMVDGIVNLTLSRSGMRTVREVEVRKFRGSNHIHGRHFFEISDDGLIVYPRLETLMANFAPPANGITEHLSFGIEGLDRLFAGGPLTGSVTSLLGPAGTGKTTIGMSFLEVGAKAGENTLLLSLYEHPDRLAKKLEKMGSRVSSYMKSGRLAVLRPSTGNFLADKVIHELLTYVKEQKVKRVFLDGLGGLKNGEFYPDRIGCILTATCHALRALGATTIAAEETDISENNFEGRLSNRSGFTDNIMEFRHVNLDGKRTVICGAVKSREDILDATIHELVFTKKGVVLGDKVRYLQPPLPVVEREENTAKPSPRGAGRR